MRLVPIAIFFLGAGLVHGLLFFALSFIPKAEDEALETTRVTFLNNANASSTPTSEDPSKPKLVKKKTQPPPDGQLVTLPDSLDPPPKNAEYIARANQKTERETRARVRDPLFTKPGRKSGSAKLDSSAAKTSPKVADEGKRGRRKSTPDKRSTSPERLEELKTTMAEEGTLKSQPKLRGLKDVQTPREEAMGPPEYSELNGREGLGRRGEGDGKSPLTLKDLSPTAEEIARAIGSAPPDHLPNVEYGSETRLNAWKWVHAGFFDRIKSAVSRNWHIQSAYRRADPNGDVYGTLTMRTALQITIDRKGALKDLTIINAAEGRFADDAALNAFRAAAPFVNPPPALFKDKETFTFRFDFIVDSSRKSGINFNWKPY